MHFVEQLASSAGPQAPSHQLLSSLRLKSRSAAAGNVHGDHAYSGAWLHDLKTASGLPPSMHSTAELEREELLAELARDELRAALALPHRNMHGGGHLTILDNARYTVQDEADTTAGADVAVDTMYTRAREAAGFVPPHPAMDEYDSMDIIDEDAAAESKDEDFAAAESDGMCADGMLAELQLESAVDTVNSSFYEHNVHVRAEGVGRESESRAEVERSWVQAAQGIRGMAELDAASAVPGLLFGVSSTTLPAAQPSAYGTLPPIRPLGNTGTWAAGREWVPPWPCMHAHEACDGPVHASVCEDGGLRCVVWERRGRQSIEQRREAVEESDLHNTGDMPGSGGAQGCSSGGTARTHGDGSSVPVCHRNSLKTAPAALMWCRDPSSSAVGGVRLQGVRKRPPGGPAACAADLQKAPRQEGCTAIGTAGRPCTRGDMQQMLFMPIQAELFTVPMD